MAPSKKRKRNETVYTCQICMTDRIDSRFPDFNPTEKCKHLINTCRGCLRDWIESRINDTAVKGGIPCPECDELMGVDGIEQVSSKKTIKQFIDLDRRRIESERPGWAWCMNCKSGQVHPYVLQQHTKAQEAENAAAESKVTRSKAVELKTTSTPQPTKHNRVSNATLFICVECKYRSCVSCNRPWHVGESCDAYLKRTTGHHAIEEFKSLKTLHKVSKNCPTCQRPTIKNGGCNHMYCNMCSTPWCWHCGETTDKAGYCKCARDAIARAEAMEAERRQQEAMGVGEEVHVAVRQG